MPETNDLSTLVELAEQNQKSNEQKFSELEEKLETLTATRKSTDVESKTDEASEAFQKYLRTGEVTDKKYLVEGTGSAGGFIVPTDARFDIFNKIVEHSPIRDFATVLQTSTNKVTVPVEAGQFAAAWTAEAGTRSNSTGQTFGQVELDLHEMYIRVPVSNALLEDSAVNLEQWLVERAARQFAKLEGAGFVTGTGSGQPTGLTLVSAAMPTHATAGTALTADDVLAAYYALPAEYAANAVWVMNRATVAMLRKLKVTAGSEYVWQPAFADAPATLMGRPIIESPDMPTATTAGTNIAIFADLQSAYAIADRLQLEVSRDPFSDADKGNTVFRIRRRVGGNVLLKEAGVVLKYKAGAG